MVTAMAATSEERREVAARLHEFADTDVWLSAMFAVLEKFGDTDRRSADVIADLIDPTCEVEGSKPLYMDDETEFQLSCGHAVWMTTNEPPAYCTECGARVIS